MTPLLDALTAYSNKATNRFHVPGHKGCADILHCLKQVLPYDVTELPDTGSLFDGEGATAEAERLAAQLFGTAATFYSTGGCTLCIQAMIKLAVPIGGKLILSRIIHKSAINTLALLHITPVWVYPRQDAGEGLAGRIQPSDIKQTILENPDASGVYLTSPDYYGVMCDISAISEVCRKYSLPLLVDNAHGAHLWFTREKLHPIQCGASMTACSSHKTLPVLTGGACLNIAEKRYVPFARDAMALFGSTSPSFLTLLSLDLCRQWLEQEGRESFDKLRQQVDRVKACALERGMLLPEGLCDPMRITLNTASIGYTGQQAADYLRRNGVEPEFFDSAFVVLIPSSFNTENDFDRLIHLIEKMPVQKRLSIVDKRPSPLQMVMDPARAVMLPSIRVPLQKAVGRIAAKTSCPCPPGIPIVMPGELITEQAAACLREYALTEIEVVD